MDLTFVICPNLLGVLGLTVLLVFTRFNFYLKDRELHLFRIAAVINLAIILFEVADYLLGGSPFPSAYLLRRVTSAAGFALSPVLPLLISCIAAQRAASRWVYFPACANIVISFCSIFTGHMFYIDQWNSYYRGPLFFAMIAISAFYLGRLLYISFRNLKSVHASEAVFLICIAAIILVGNLLEIALSFHFLIWNSCAVLLICYYLYLHIQYFKLDPLTQAFNRGMFSAALSSPGRKSGVGVLSFDLDNLKKINDREGHERGDAYIIAAARLIEQCFQDVGRLYRIGGDEFMVLMSGTTEGTIRDKIELFQIKCRQEAISVSCGYAFDLSADDLSQMLRDADKAMYENKNDRQRQ